MKTYFCLTVLLLAFTLGSCHPTNNESPAEASAQNLKAVIYDGDTREDVSLDDNLLGELAKATSILVHSHKLTNNNDSYILETRGLKKTYLLCPDEKFLDQSIIGHCSGVLVAPDKVLTAGHCFQNKDRCAKSSFIFGWNINKAQQPELHASEVYHCQQVLKLSLIPNKNIDYAIIQLDREVTNATPVRLAEHSVFNEGDELISLSYPLGLPLKMDLATVKSDNEESLAFRVKVDTFAGSSGSPLFNAHGELAGILIKGAEDILEDDIYRIQKEGGCINFNSCKAGYCMGETFLKTSTLDL